MLLRSHLLSRQPIPTWLSSTLSTCRLVYPILSAHSLALTNSVPTETSTSTTATVCASLCLMHVITTKSGTKQPEIAVALVIASTPILLTSPHAPANVTSRLLALAANSVTW